MIAIVVIILFLLDELYFSPHRDIIDGDGGGNQDPQLLNPSKSGPPISDKAIRLITTWLTIFYLPYAFYPSRSLAATIISTPPAIILYQTFYGPAETSFGGNPVDAHLPVTKSPESRRLKVNHQSWDSCRHSTHRPTNSSQSSNPQPGPNHRISLGPHLRSQLCLKPNGTLHPRTLHPRCHTCGHVWGDFRSGLRGERIWCGSGSNEANCHVPIGTTASRTCTLACAKVLQRAD